MYGNSIILPRGLASLYIFDIILKVGVAALICPFISLKGDVMKGTWSASLHWYSHVVLWARNFGNADILDNCICCAKE